MLGFSALGAFMANISGHVGQLVERVADAIQGYGQYMIDQAEDATSMNMVAYAWFNVDPENQGLIYWINDKLVYLLVELNNATDGLVPASWAGLEDLLIALTNAGIL